MSLANKVIETPEFVLTKQLGVGGRGRESGEHLLLQKLNVIVLILTPAREISIRKSSPRELEVPANQKDLK